MSRVAWSRYGGDDIEAVVSMFVCREIPGAFRVRPSRGDGGIDVCVPISKNVVEVYQVKKFASNLGASEKAQIVHSHERLQEYARAHSLTVKRWHLTLPLDPTPDNREWLAQLEAQGDFPCSWVGLAQIEAWASAHPDIVDYYLRDGRDRLRDELARFVAASGIPINDRQVSSTANFADFEPSMTHAHLAALRDTLNQRDPHFQYDISIGQQPLELSPRAGGYPALVASTFRQVGDSWVTFHVLARGAESIRERPITFEGKLTVAAGSQEQREFEEFRRYGRPPTIPLGVSDYAMNLPGGLGGEFRTGTLTLREPVGGQTFERRLEIFSPTSETLAAVTLTMNPPTTNLDSTGVYNKGTDAAGFLTVETLATMDNGSFDMKLRLTPGDATGHFPDRIEQSLAVVTQFHAPNRMRLSAVRGNSSVEHDLPQQRTDSEGLRWSRLVLRYVRALMTIQEHISTELKVPDLDSEDFDHMQGVMRAARLLDGEIVEASWGGTQFTMRAGVDVPEGLQQVMFHHQLDVEVGEARIPLGWLLVTTGPVEFEVDASDEAGEVTADLVPALGKNTVQLRWLGADSIGQQEVELG